MYNKQEIISLKKYIKMNWWVESTKTFVQLNYIEKFLILIFAITGCIAISACASLLGIPIRITSSIIGLKTCVLVIVKT